MATFTERCPKCRRGTVHSGHSWKKSRYTMRGKVIDTYRCAGVRRAGR